MRITMMTADIQISHQCESIERVHGDEGDFVAAQPTATIHKQKTRQKHESIYYYRYKHQQRKITLRLPNYNFYQLQLKQVQLANVLHCRLDGGTELKLGQHRCTSALL